MTPSSITPSIILDVGQSGGGVQIKTRSTDEAWFVLKFEKQGSLFRRRNVTTIHRKPIDAKGTLPYHFAQWDEKKLEIVQKSKDGDTQKPGISKIYKTKNFLQKREHADFFEAANIFHVDHVPYQLVKAPGRSLELFATADPTTPLALFRTHSSFSSAIASIRIYPAGVGIDIEEPETCLVWDGKPTKLLERAIIAQRICKASEPWWRRV